MLNLSGSSAIHYDFLTGQFFNVDNDVLIAIDMLVLVDLDISAFSDFLLDVGFARCSETEKKLPR